jgi:hypothetical protein
LGWPPGIDGRAIANEIIEDEEKGLGIEERVRRHDECKAKGGESHLVVWTGAGVGNITELKNASVCLKVDSPRYMLEVLFF